MRRTSHGVTGAASAIILVVGVALIVVASLFAAGVFPGVVSLSGTTTTVSAPTTVDSSSGAGNSSSTTTLDMTTTQVTFTLSSSTIPSLTTSSVSLTSSTSTVLSTSTTTSSSTLTATTSSTTTTVTITSSRSTSTSATSTQPGTVQIILPQDVGNNESLNFTPSKVKVVIGVNNTIVWNDEDYVQHTVQSVSVPNGASRWNSGILNEGQSYTVTLTVPGNYKYDCSIHPDWMVGTIQVLA